MKGKDVVIFYTGKLNRVAGKMKKLRVFFFLLAMTGCVFDIQDWEPKDEDLLLSVQKCRTEMLLRGPYLGPFWHFIKNFEPCMRGTDHNKK